MVCAKGLRSVRLGFGVLFLGAGLSTVQASIIDVDSNGGPDEYNVENGVSVNPDVAIAVSPSWAPDGTGFEWVSYAATGCNTFVVLTGVCAAGVDNPAAAASPITLPTPSTPTAIFFNNFTLPAGDTYSGTLSVWADDTARVYLDGVLLIDANPVPGNNCADAPVGCLPDMDYTVNLASLGILTAGINTLEIDAYQFLGGSPFGVMYTAAIDAESPDSPAPEPASYVLMGLGLAAIGLVARRARRA